MSELTLERYIDDKGCINVLTLIADLIDKKDNPYIYFALGALSAALIEAIKAAEDGDVDLAAAYLKEIKRK